jgi:hypothetical protein
MSAPLRGHPLFVEQGATDQIGHPGLDHADEEVDLAPLQHRG